MATKGFRSAVARRGAALVVAALTVTAVVGCLVLRASAPATAEGAAGYWLAGNDGGVFNYGQASFYGSAGSVPLNNPVVGFVPTPKGGGYWMVASDGGIFAFGDAAFLGSMGGKPLNRPIAAMAATPSGKGYWLVASDGGIFAFGDAPFFGSMAGENLTKPIVDFAVTPTGRGYWMATSNGAVYGFGDAAYYGSVGDGVDLNRRIQAFAPTPTGNGYWLVGGDGVVFPFGDAADFGSAVGKTEKRVIDIAPTATGRGYYLVTSNGQVFPFGDATPYGDPSRGKLNDQIIALAVAVPGAPPPAQPNPPPSAAPAPSGPLQAVDDTADGAEDTPLNIDVLANDRAPSGGGPLTLQSVTPPQHGRTSIADNRVLYQPAPDYHGPDTFTYTVRDAQGETSTAAVHVNLASVDDRPEAVDDAVTITDGAATTIDVLANDRGLGDGVKSVSIAQPPAHGQAAVTPEQRVTYTPAGGFSGTDVFQYTVTDTDDESSTAKVTVTLGGNGAHHGPVAVDDNVTTRSGRPTPALDVTANDDVAGGVREVRFADPNGAPLDAPDVSTAAGGVARRNGTRITYTAPAGGFTGSDSFTYVVIDNSGEVSKPATVHATVVTNKPPQVKDGWVAVPQNRQAIGSIAKLGWDPEKDAITFSLRSSPAGQLTLKPDGTFLYQAPTGVDVDNFSFVANDGNSDSNEGHLSIQITQAQASSASTTTTGPSASSSTTSTTRKGSTTATTARSSTTQTTARSSTTNTTTKGSGTTTKGKKTTGSNNRGKPAPSSTTTTTTASTTPASPPTTSTSSRSKALLVPILPLAAAPAVTRRGRRWHRRAAR